MSTIRDIALFCALTFVIIGSAVAICAGLIWYSLQDRAPAAKRAPQACERVYMAPTDRAAPHCVKV